MQSHEKTQVLTKGKLLLSQEGCVQEDQCHEQGYIN